MTILELKSLTAAQLADLADLMHELSPDMAVDPAKIVAAVECPATRVFAVVDGGDSCVGSGESTNCVASKNTVGDSSKNTVGDSSENTVGDASKNTVGDAGKNTVEGASKNTVGDASKNTVGDASESTDAVAGGSTREAAGGGRIVGCASLCVFDSPTGRKGHIEDVVVSSACRGRHLGRKLLEHILDYARTDLAPIDIHLTSRPSRVAANTLYRSLGFEQRDTNVYRLIIK